MFGIPKLMMTMRKEIDDDNAHFTVKHHDFVVLSPGGGGGGGRRDRILNVRKGSRSKMNEVNAPLSFTYVRMCSMMPFQNHCTAPPQENNDPRRTNACPSRSNLLAEKKTLSVCLSVLHRECCVTSTLWFCTIFSNRLAFHLNVCLYSASIHLLVNRIVRMSLSRHPFTTMRRHRHLIEARHSFIQCDRVIMLCCPR